MRFTIIPRPLSAGALVGGLERSHHQRRRELWELAPGRSAIVVVHADGCDGPVRRVEELPGPWGEVARGQLGQLASLTPQGLADYFDGVVVRDDEPVPWAGP